MPRTKEFEPEAALHHAMELFWCNGYEATSMRDLLKGTGIGRGSFYDTYGDKHSLFQAALDRFERTRTAWIPEALEEGDSSLKAIRYVFERTVDSLVGFEPRRGCLLANSAVELAPYDLEVADRIPPVRQAHRGCVRESSEAHPGRRRVPRTRRPEGSSPLLRYQPARPARHGAGRR